MALTLLMGSALAGCGGGGPSGYSPAAGYLDCVQIGDTIYTVDDEYSAGGTYGSCDGFRARGLTPVPMPQTLLASRL